MVLDREQVTKAVTALLKHESGGGAKKKKAQLFEESDAKVISLVLGMKEFPDNKRSKPYQIAIPHSLHTESEICIIVKDPQKALKERLEAEPIDGVVKIIGITKLRDNYKTFEAKRNLCDSYDLFMVDRRVLPMLPKLIGKSFFQKKKCADSPAAGALALACVRPHLFCSAARLTRCCHRARRQPVPIEIAKSNIGLRVNVAKARDSTLLYLGDGPCSMIKVASTGMDVEEIVANIIAASDAVAHRIPKKWANVQAFDIKTHDSVALPIYASLPEVTALPS